MSDEERAEFERVFKAASLGQIPIEEAVDRFGAMGITRLGIVSATPEGFNLN